MKPIERVDISVESRIVANIVSNTELLNQCSNLIDPTLFESPVTQIVVEWALDYYTRQKTAPAKNMKEIFVARKSELNDTTAEMVYSYMKNGDWSPIDNIEFSKKQLTDYLQKRSMQRLIEKLNKKIESGNVKDCENAIAEWQKPEIRKSNALDLFNNIQKISETMDKEDEPDILSFGDDDLGKTIGSFKLSDFVIFLAPAKRGKSWWLIDLALKGALHGNKVLYISLEMTEGEVVNRFMRMLSGCSKTGDYVDTCKFHECSEGKYEIKKVRIPTRKFNSSKKSVGKLLANARKYSEGGELKIITAPTDSYTIEDLRKDLNTLETFEHFVPTMVVIDYADIMRFQHTNEKRFGLDNLYLGLRGINLERKFCLVTASQGGRQNVTGENDITEADIAECASKLNHSTKVILINQNREEKKDGIYRMLVNMSRHGGVSYETCLVTSCLDIGRVYTDSKALSKIYIPKLDEDGGHQLSMGGFKRKPKNYAE